MTEKQYEKAIKNFGWMSQYSMCTQCSAWYHGVKKFKAKRIYES